MTGRPPKLTPEQVKAIREHHAAGISATAIATLYCLSRSTVLRYLRGECRHHKAP